MPDLSEHRASLNKNISRRLMPWLSEAPSPGISEANHGKVRSKK